jgi:phospholipid/cholesterol/gamma-HCH transport system permease protein
MHAAQKIIWFLRAIGKAILEASKTALRMIWFLFSILMRGIQGPFYAKQVLKQWMFMGFFSIPLVALTALFTGMVLALQSYTTFTRFSTESMALPEVVALSMIRELGPVLSALMMAGRWGASIAAELATMRVSNQLDALLTLSTHPLRYLVIPRLLVAIVALPFLTLIADVIGILGGYSVALTTCHAHGPQYIGRTLEILLFGDVLLGLTKAACFGFIIAFMGCYEGFYAERGAEGVGIATTRGVVRSCIAILLSNYLLTYLFFGRA